jgi:hypothetical protein
MLDESKRKTARRHLFLLLIGVLGVLVILSILLPR